MKKIVGIILSIVFGVIPYSGLLFLMTVIAAGVSAYFSIGPAVIASNIFCYGWKIYIFFTFTTVFCMTTFSFQQCCVGFSTFSEHMRHHGWGHLESLLVGLLWPISWYTVDRNLRGWGLGWMYVVFGTMEYWLVTTRRGVRIECMTADGCSTARSKSPEESLGIIKDFIEK